MTLLVKSVIALLCLIALINAHGGKGKGEVASSSTGPPPWAPAVVGLRKKVNPGFSLRFDGVNDFVEIPEIKIGGPMSFEFSILPRSGAATLSTFLFFSDQNGKNSIELAYNPSTGVIVLILTDNSRVERSRTETTSHALAFNSWNYYGITIDNQGNVKIYKEARNGNMDVVSTSSSGTYVPVFAARKAAFMGRNLGTTSFFHGDLDNILIWTKVLRRQDFVRDRSVEEQSPSLIAWWDLDQGSGLQCLDFSSNHRHGVLGGNSPNFAPRWIYSANVPKKSCTFWHSLFSLTFDSRLLWHEIWRLTGEFWLVRSTPDSEGFSDIAVQVALEESRKIPISSVTGFGLKVFSDMIVFDLDFTDKIDSVLSINGQVVSDSQVYLPEHSVTLSKTYQGKKGDHRWKIDIPHLFEVEIQARPRFDFVELKVTIPRYWQDSEDPKLSGICGNYDGQSSNDIDNTLWPVDAPDSFFVPHVYEPIPDDLPDYSCDINQTTPEFQAKARLVCENELFILPALRAACLETVCTSGSFEAAVDLARVTFENCIDDFIASNEGSDDENAANPCYEPCPNFCSLNGQCVDGDCQCDEGWVGTDCSQQVSFPCFKATWPTGEEYILEPFRGLSSVAQHYSYSSPNWWSSNTNLEISRSSVLYLYEQVIPGTAVDPPESHLNLVILNGKANDGFGGRVDLAGSISMDPADLADLHIRVADDGNDVVSLVGDSLQAQWVWWRCCGDGLALGDLPTGNPFCITLNYTQTAGVDQIVVSNQNQFGAQDLFGVDLAASQTVASVSICGDNCTAECAFHTDCESCSLDPQCGWCQESQLCTVGTARGPRDGYCSFWRYSIDADASRVLTSSLTFPVQPSQIKVVLGSDELAADFTVTVPHPKAAALDLVLLQDLTASFGSDLQLIKSQTINIFQALREDYPWMRLGIASFTDFPDNIHGSNASGDYAYRTNLPLTSHLPSIFNTLQDLVTANGGDALNAQLEALRSVALDQSIGWRSSATRVVVMVTKSAFHSGETNDAYPLPSEVRQALLERNIVPIIVSPSGVHAPYQELVSSFGFGSAHIASAVATGSIFSEISSALSTILSTVQVIPLESTTLDRWTPVAGYRGLSPLTRVTFNVFLQQSSGSSSGRTVLVVPGFGRVDISSTPSDLPVVAPCPSDISVDSDSEVILSLKGTSFYPDPLVAVITSLPSGATLYQFVETGRGDEIVENATVTDPEGRVIFVPDDSSVDQISSVGFLLKDSCAGCSPSSSCQVSIRGVASPPTANAVPPLLEIPESSNGSITLQSSVEATFLIIQAPSKGQLIGSNGLLSSGDYVSDGLLTFVPKPFRFGSPYTTFVWQAKTTNGLRTDPSEYTINVTPVNDAPIAHPASFAVDESSVGNTFQLTASQTWGENDPLSWALEDTSVEGTISISATGVVTFSPTPLFRGETSFVFRVSDHESLFSTATVTITVRPVPRVPRALPVNLSTLENQRVNFTLIGEEDDNGSLVAFIASWNGPGILRQSDGLVVPKATPNVAVTSSNFQLEYEPPAYEHSPPFPFASFSYFVVSEFGLTSEASTVGIDVDDVPHLPETIPAGTVTVAQGNSTSFNLKAIDYDEDDNVRFFICTAPEGALSREDGTPVGAEGELFPVTRALSSAFIRKVRVTFQADRLSEGDSFSFRVESAGDVSDCQEVSINVTTVPFPPPVALLPDPLPVGNQDENVTFELRGEDPTDPPESLIFRVLSLPNADSGRLFEVDGGEEIVTPRTVSRGLRYLPAPGAFGMPQGVFEFCVVNSFGLESDPLEVPIDIEEVILPPSVSNSSFSLDQFTSKVIRLSASDRKYDLIDLTFTVVDSVNNGQLFACVDEDCASPQAIPVSGVLLSRWLLYVPDTEFFGEDSLTFTASNPAGEISPVGYAALNVVRVNRPPVAVPPPGPISLSELESTLIQLDGTDPDSDSLVFTITNDNFLGDLAQVTLEGTAGEPITLAGEEVTDPSKRVSYTAGYNPTEEDPYTFIIFRVTDPDGAWDEATIVIQVERINTRPDATLSEAEGDANSLLTITLLATDNSPNGPHSFEFDIVETPAFGSLFQFGSSEPIAPGTRVTDSLGRVQFRGDGVEYGNPYANFSYTATNEVTTLTSFPSVVQVTLRPIAVAPQLGMIPPTLDQGSSVIIELGIINRDELHPDANISFYITLNPLGSLFQVDADGAPTTEVIDSSEFPIRVTNPNGHVYYVPFETGFGEPYTSFGYFANESVGGLPCCDNVYTDAVNIAINVLRVNTAPQAFNVSHRGFNDELLTTVSLSFQDAENDPLVGRFVQLPVNGNLYKGSYDAGHIVTENTTFNELQPFFTYRPFITTGEAFGSNYDSFVYSLSDSEFTVFASGIINIEYRNLPPNPLIGHLPEISLFEDTSKSFVLNATDDGDYFNIFYIFTSLPSVGELLYNGQPISVGVALEPPLVPPWPFLYTPPPNFNTFNADLEEHVPLTFTYTVRDQSQAFFPDELTTAIIVEAVNDPPSFETNTTSYVSYYVNNARSYPAIASDIQILDDAVVGELSVNITCQVPIFGTFQSCQQRVSHIWFMDDSSLTSIEYLDNRTIRASGTLAGINAAFANGLRIDPVLGSNSWGETLLAISVSDNGYYGLGEGGATRTIYITERKWNLYHNETTSPVPPPGTGPAIVAMVGLTSLVSMSFFGAYQLMKKKHIIPEEADPWENDALWDATLDNPLYNTDPPAFSFE